MTLYPSQYRTHCIPFVFPEIHAVAIKATLGKKKKESSSKGYNTKATMVMLISHHYRILVTFGRFCVHELEKKQATLTRLGLTRI